MGARGATRRVRNKVAPANTLVAYLRVSTEEQANSGAGLAAQRASIEAEAERRGAVVVEWCVDAGLSGKSMERPSLVKALAHVRERRAEGIIVAKLDRLSRSLRDFAELMAEAKAGKWNIVAIDLNIDLSSPTGEFMATVMAAIAQWERRIIGQRTREGLAEKRAAGVRLGRPRRLPDAVLWRIIDLRSNGRSFQEISDALDAEDVPTAQGGQWYPATVRKVLLSQDAASMMSGHWVAAPDQSADLP